MLLFLATVIEQLDLALEQVLKRDIHNVRFGLMLTDNALELVLHQVAKHKASELKLYSWNATPYIHQKSLDKALGRTFGDKVNYARLAGLMTDETATTIKIMHEFRNEVYHVGIQHESILPALSSFYFDVVSELLARHQPPYLSWGSNLKLPDRAKKYFSEGRQILGRQDDFSNACITLKRACGHCAAQTIETLVDHLESVVEAQDRCINVIAEGVYADQKTTRDKAVIDCQTWPLAFSEEGKAFALERAFAGTTGEFVEWLGKTYPLKFRGDPIPGWQKRAKKLRREKNPHAVIRHYDAFMRETAEIREAIEESTAACEAEIDAAIDRARGK